MRLHARFGPILPNRKQRYCGPEGPEIDGQTKMAKNSRYSCNKISKAWIQISRQNWFGFFSNIGHQKRYCGLEGPEIDGQKKMAKNSWITQRGSLLSLLIVVARQFLAF